MDVVKVIRELHRKSDDFRCFKRAYFILINRLLCIRPVLIYDVVSRLIDYQYRHCQSENDNNKRKINMLCVFLRYYKRLQIRNEVYSLPQTLKMCPRIMGRNDLRSLHRIKRQFDMQSLIFFWKSLLDNQSGFEDTGIMGSTIEQFTYINGPLQSCVIRSLTNV